MYACKIGAIIILKIIIKIKRYNLMEAYLIHFPHVNHRTVYFLILSLTCPLRLKNESLILTYSIVTLEKLY